MDLEKSSREYRTPDEARELVRKTKITLLSGVSSAGKDSTKHEILKQPDFRGIVSLTTRPLRENNGRMEKDGVDYHFVSDEYAANMVRWKKLVEFKPVHGYLYGTPISEIENAYKENKIAVGDVDVKGVAEYKAISSDVVALFIVPPSYDEWIERATHRYTSQEEFEREWPNRQATSIQELAHALEVDYFHFIINHDIGRTALVASEIARNGNQYNHKDDEARIATKALLQSMLARAA